MSKRKPWSPDEVEALRQLYPHHTARFVANVMGRDVSSVYNKAFSLQLEKSDAFWQSDASGRTRRGKQDPRMRATQFKKGQAPWNQGIKGSAGLHPNSRATQFKKGRAAQESCNYLPIGSQRVTKGGLLERKVTDNHPVPARRWVAVHRLVWEAANGPVPEGHIVVFKDKRRTVVPEEITLDRLECISRAENARRNHPSRRSPEYHKLVQLKGAITRQLNRIRKEAEEREMACTGKS